MDDYSNHFIRPSFLRGSFFCPEPDQLNLKGPPTGGTERLPVYYPLRCGEKFRVGDGLVDTKFFPSNHPQGQKVINIISPSIIRVDPSVDPSGEVIVPLIYEPVYMGLLYPFKWILDDPDPTEGRG